jgi:hypothetical protein
MNNERYNQIVDEAYENYRSKASMSNDLDCLVRQEEGSFLKEIRLHTQEEFINKCKTDPEFSQKWNLQIKETYDLIPHTEYFGDVTITKPIRRNKLIVVYKNEIIEGYE